VIVVDASVIVDLLLRVPGSDLLQAELLSPGVVLSAPHLLDIEVAQVLRRCVLQRQLGSDRASEALQDLTDFPLDRYPHTLLLPRVWAFRDNLSAYDACYLALAEALDCAVVTRDARFAGSPAAGGRVRLV
jgi:predicted nucleic acid-binding protein